MRCSHRLAPLLAVIVLAVPAAAAAAEAQGFTPWLNDYLAEQVKVAVSTRSNANQVEAPSASTNTSSLVDTSSASDLVGVALNVAGLSEGTADSDVENDATTGAVTVSAYALRSAALGVDPLDPSVYCGGGGLGPARYWRRVSFTLGFDDEDKDNTGENSPIVAGAKAILFTKRDVCDADFSRVQAALESATGRVSGLVMRIQDELYARYQAGRLPGVDPGLSQVAFLNALRKPEFFGPVLDAVGEQEIGKLVSEADLRDLVNLHDETRKAIDDFRGQPQLAATFITKQRSDGIDEYRGALVFDKGINDRLTFSANASWEVKDGDDRTIDTSQLLTAMR